MTGCPTAVARYSAETSHTVSEGGAPKATPMGTRATAIIEELIGFSTEPRTIGAMSRRSKPLGAGRAARGSWVSFGITAPTAVPSAPAP